MTRAELKALADASHAQVEANTALRFKLYFALLTEAPVVVEPRTVR